MQKRTSKGKYQNDYTLTTITEAAGIYVIVTAYYKDSACGKISGRTPSMSCTPDQEEAENWYEGITGSLFKNLKEE
jgi:hypothetical protein